MPTPIDPYNPTGGVPGDQAMLLRVIDARFETSNTKVDGVATSLKNLVDAVQVLTARYDKRFDDHEHRLAVIEGEMQARKLQVAEFNAFKQKVGEIELWKAEEQTTSRNANKWVSVIWSVIGGGITSGVLFIATMYFQAQPAPAVQHSAPAEVTRTQSTEVSTTVPVRTR